MNGKCQSTFDTGCILEVEYSEIIADVNFAGIADHPETALRVEITMTGTESEHACLNAH